jgi:hypothetical protein
VASYVYPFWFAIFFIKIATVFNDICCCISNLKKKVVFALIYICESVQVLMVASMKITVFCDRAPCSLIEVDGRFRGAYCFQH